MMAAAEDHQVAVRSGHKVGKSLLISILALWWAVCWPMGKVLITAPSSDQIRDIVWAEVVSLVHRARQRGLIDVPEPALSPSTGIRWPDGRRIIGRSTDRPERLQGYSGPACLYLIDEASGFGRQLYEALLGNTGGGSANDDRAVAKFVLTGNPTQTTGIFYDAFHREREHWRKFQISSSDTPNAKAGKVLIPGLATSDYVERLRRSYGEDTDQFRVRVLGQFPTQGSNAVIPVSLLEQRSKAWADATPNLDNRLHLGVDVARFGDDASAIAPRRGGYLYKLRVHHGMDTAEVAGLTLRAARELRRKDKHERPLVKVDTIGVGAGVADILRQSDDVDVVDVNVASSPTDPEEYPKLRDELWFAVAGWLAEGGVIPDDDMLIGELGAPGYKVDPRGRRAVEPKDATKKKLGRSPDLADALALALYDCEVDTELLTFGGRYY